MLPYSWCAWCWHEYCRVGTREKGRDDRCLHAAPTLNVKVFDDTLVRLLFNFIKKFPHINIQHCSTTFRFNKWNLWLCEFMAELLRSSGSRLCRAERQLFEPRPTNLLFLYRLPQSKIIYLYNTNLLLILPIFLRTGQQPTETDLLRKKRL